MGYEDRLGLSILESTGRISECGIPGVAKRMDFVSAELRRKGWIVECRHVGSVSLDISPATHMPNAQRL